MNARQLQLFQNLEALVASNEAFYRQVFTLDGKTYWIYNYRLASYSDFLAPDAMEARGTMFEVDNVGVPIRLAVMPISKFFNRFENPITMDVDLSTVVSIMNKMDGSLISTYMHGDVLRLKTKGSLFSDQAINAMAWLDLPKNVYFKQLLTDFTVGGTTVNLEWTAPDNRIVLGYLEPKLFVLNARSMDTGEYVDPWIFEDYVAPSVDLNGLNIVEFVNNIPNMLDDIEGYVVKLPHLWMKIKTLKYLSLHHAKDSVNNPRRLFEAVLSEGIDDLRSMFHEDVLAMQIIDEMQIKVDKIYNHAVATVEGFYEANKNLSRKEYAIKGQAELEHLYFGQAMTKYLQKPVDYKAFLISKYKELGFKDEAAIPTGEE
jgi:T4 RnlA family RNA ligase